MAGALPQVSLEGFRGLAGLISADSIFAMATSSAFSSSHALHPSNNSRGRLDCRMMERSVPMRSWAWAGTSTVIVLSPTFLCITT